MAGQRRPVTSMGTVAAFLNGRACSDALCHVLNRAYEGPMPAEERATQPFAGGILQHGYQCGMIWGAVLAAGAQAHRQLGQGPSAEAAAVAAATRLVESFRAQNQGHINCMEITDIDKSSTAIEMVIYFLLKGGSVRCFRRAGRYAPPAFAAIEAALGAEPAEVPDAPVSCAAELARRMGASELHVTMAAGLAGGIGLSGGACGALGAAIWLTVMRVAEETQGEVAWKDPQALALIDRFMSVTDYAFECAEIVGRHFDGVADHAAHLRQGGCAGIIEALAANQPDAVKRSA